MTAPLDEKLQNVKWGEFKVGELFDADVGDIDLQKKHITKDGEFIISAGEYNYGILGRTNIKAKIFNKNTITFDMFGNVYFRCFEYKMVTHARVISLKWKYKINEKIGNYLVTVLRKFKPNFSYSKMATWNKVRNIILSLPITPQGDIDFEFMQDFVEQIEQEQMKKLREYLQSQGLYDTRLTKDEEEALKEFDNLKWGEFKVGELFKVYSPKKRFNAIDVKFGGNYPYVARSSINNGIRGYITENTRFLSPANTISFGQDTATMFFQERAYFTGDKIKVMKLLQKELNSKLACYLITCMKKSFSTFGWGQKSFNEKVLNDTTVSLPITLQGDIDFDFMQNYIVAIQKLCIKNVMKEKSFL